MNVFDYDVAEKQRILQNQSDETSEGGVHKKCRRDEECLTM